MWLKKLRAKRARKAAVAAESVAGSVDSGIVPPTSIAPINDVVLARPAARQATDHLGMQGYAPSVRVSRNRIRCEGCRELVKPGVRHICIYNAHHHLDTLTIEERLVLIAQLKALGVKPN